MGAGPARNDPSRSRSALLLGTVSQLRPAVPIGTHIRAEGAAASRRHAGRVEHVHGQLSGTAAGGVRVGALVNRPAGGAAAGDGAGHRAGARGADATDRRAAWVATAAAGE